MENYKIEKIELNSDEKEIYDYLLIKKKMNIL